MKSSLTRTVAFIKGDYVSIFRDSMMTIMVVAPLLMGLLFEVLIPYITDTVDRLFQYDITPYLPGAAGFLVQIPALMYGLVAGFIIIDERDEGVLQYLTVTPLSRQGYLFYRITAPALASIVAAAVFCFISGLVPVFTLKLFPLLVQSSLNTPLLALFLAAYARNKITALTLAKAASVTFLPGFVLFFTDSPLQYIAGITPSFWTMKAMITLYSSDPVTLLYPLAGACCTLGYMWFFNRQFLRKVI